jgi:hypothetical protein
MADLIPDLVKGGDSAASAWDRLAQSLQDAAWQALLLGEGPLASLFGLAGGSGGQAGGLLGLVGSLFGFAEGGDPFSPKGKIHGPGGPRADKRLVRVSAGEFIMNAEATQKNRALLEAMNAGAALPGFARGGAVDGGAGGWRAPTAKIELLPQTRTPIAIEQGEERSSPDGTRIQRFILSDAVAEGINARGGRARETLAGQFGLRQRRQPR